MSPAVNVDLEDVPFAILEAVKARILANRARINDARLRPSTRPRPQFRKTGASSSSWKLPQHGAAAVDDGVALWQVQKTEYTIEALYPSIDYPFTWQGITFTAASDFTIRFVGRVENPEATFPYYEVYNPYPAYSKADFPVQTPSTLPIRVFRKLTAGLSPYFEYEQILETRLSDRGTHFYAGGYHYIEIEPIEVKKGETYAIIAEWRNWDNTNNLNDVFQEFAYLYSPDFEELTGRPFFDPDDPFFSAAVPNQDLVSDIFHTYGSLLPEYTLKPISYPSSGQIYGALYRMTTSFAIDDVDNAKPDWAYIGAPTPVGGRTLPWTGF